ncbi:MAG: hypothetical protein B7Z37_06410 [Verrucomicrobia bacterium 12-59-8]|nr:MAG: hypothetical protein B7Z37_06410 [Verrucomicrobia bacterium 12-59-8]
MPSTDPQCRHASSTSIVVTVAGLLTRPFFKAFDSEELSLKGVTQRCLRARVLYALLSESVMDSDKLIHTQTNTSIKI